MLIATILGFVFKELSQNDSTLLNTFLSWLDTETGKKEEMVLIEINHLVKKIWEHVAWMI